MDKRACIYLIVFVFVLVSAYVIVSLRRNPEIRAEDAKAGAFVENGRKAYRIASEQLFLADFSGDKSLKDYNSDENGWRISSSTAGEIRDGRFYPNKKSIDFTGRFMPGDDYGAEASVIRFDLLFGSGSVEVGLRKILETDKKTDSGIWFTFRDNTIQIEEQSSGVNLELSPYGEGGAPAEASFEFTDTHEALSLYLTAGESRRLLLSVAYNENDISVFDGEGSALAEAVPHNNIPLNGYFTVSLKSFDGALDNLSYNRYELDFSLPEAQQRAVDYSSWIAADDLGRITPTNSETGNKREDKYVGLFYFLCNEYTGAPREVRDFTRMYLNYGVDYIKEHIKTSPGGYWAEPFFGYYINTDEWVYRKHAYMLQQAGVDFIFLDMSNANVYEKAHVLLFDTWLQIRKEGGQTPQIVCMTGDMPSTLVIDLYTLMDSIYSKPEYEELFFQWEGKPLILGNNDTPGGETWSAATGTTPQTEEAFYAAVRKDRRVRDYYESGQFAEDLSQFTVRKCWAWQSDKHDGYWDWLSESPQPYGTDFSGSREQMAVTMGVHAHTNKGRSYVNGNAEYDRNGDFGFSYGKAQYGLLFEEQFEYALKQDPQVIMITGWNEWYAGVHDSPNPEQLTGGTLTPGRYLVDQFTPEYSRDGEPMKIRDGVGFGDNYYYQMVRYIRLFKGMDAVPVADGGGAEISMRDAAADAAEWERVSPAYTDTIGDTAFRNQISFQSEYRYQNSSGRNDLDTAKVTQDSEFLYFHITTVNEIVAENDEVWMNLYLDIDNDPSTGWEGYDLILNRSRDGETVSVERFVDNGWKFETIGSAEYLLGTNSLTIKAAKEVIRKAAPNADFKRFAFKWADASVSDGDVMRFMDLGDTAPNDRFQFLYTTEKLPAAKTGGRLSWITVLCICLAAAVLLACGGVCFFARRRRK